MTDDDCHILSAWTCEHLSNHARGVNVIVVGNEHGEPSSNPGLD